MFFFYCSAILSSSTMLQFLIFLSMLQACTIWVAPLSSMPPMTSPLVFYATRTLWKGPAVRSSRASMSQRMKQTSRAYDLKQYLCTVSRVVGSACTVNMYFFSFLRMYFYLEYSLLLENCSLFSLSSLMISLQFMLFFMLSIFSMFSFCGSEMVQISLLLPVIYYSGDSCSSCCSGWQGVSLWLPTSNSWQNAQRVKSLRGIGVFLSLKFLLWEAILSSLCSWRLSTRMMYLLLGTRESSCYMIVQQSNNNQSTMSDLILDERMLTWVFLPIIYVTFLINMFRFYFSLYTAYTTTKKPIKRVAYPDAKDKLLVDKCDNLSKKFMLLTDKAFNCRRGFLCKPEEGYLIANGDRPAVDGTEKMLAAQGSMMDGMKGMMVMMMTTIPAMAWINSFFAGFVLAKVPFSLTQQFRSMTQSGIDMENLDVSYVSSVSFYFLIVFGMSQINSLLVEDDEDSDESMKALNEDKKAQMGGGMGGMGGGGMMGGGMMGGMGGMGGAGGQGKEQKQIFKSQVEQLELVEHNFVFHNSPKQALKKLNNFLGND